MVYNTLLELYLNEIGTCRTEEGVAKEMRALELLKRPEVCVGQLIINFLQQFMVSGNVVKYLFSTFITFMLIT